MISGKRELMALLVEKTEEYLKVVDPQCNTVLQDVTLQYEQLID